MDALTQTAYARLAGIDPPRIDPMTGEEEAKVHLRIKCRPRSQVLPGGAIVHRESGVDDHGKPATTPDGHPLEGARYNFATVYETDAQAIEKLVETATEEELTRVEAEYDRRCRAWAKANGGEEADMEACPHSREEAFAWVMGRGVLPLIEVVRIGGRKGPKKAA